MVLRLYPLSTTRYPLTCQGSPAPATSRFRPHRGVENTKRLVASVRIGAPLSVSRLTWGCDVNRAESAGLGARRGDTCVSRGRLPAVGMQGNVRAAERRHISTFVHLSSLRGSNRFYQHAYRGLN